MKSKQVGKTGILRAGGVLALGLAVLCSGNLRANPGPQGTSGDEPAPVKLNVGRPVTTADIKGGVLNATIQPPKGVVVQKKEVVRNHASFKPSGHQGGEDGQGISFYPGDLSYQGGQVLQSVVSHDIYVNCDASCFGNPATFLNRLGKSDLIHVTDQYVGAHGSHRYTVGPGGIITYPVSGPLGPNDILTLVYTAASVFGTGYGHIYHIFFAPGIDVCANDALTQCYSPDNFATFFFCAFHSSVDFTDIGHVLFSVQPYANAVGCNVNPPSPNGPVVDSQANVLSHELIEAITDPDGDAWWNTYSLALFGNEIADECAQSSFSYSNVQISGHWYEIQPEYSNQSHGCTFHPSE